MKRKQAIAERAAVEARKQAELLARVPGVRAELKQQLRLLSEYCSQLERMLLQKGVTRQRCSTAQSAGVHSSTVRVVDLSGCSSDMPVKPYETLVAFLRRLKNEVPAHLRNALRVGRRDILPASEERKGSDKAMQSGEPFQLRVKSLTGNDIVLTVNTSESIEDVKRRVEVSCTRAMDECQQRDMLCVRSTIQLADVIVLSCAWTLHRRRQTFHTASRSWSTQADVWTMERHSTAFRAMPHCC
jgi:hypothetical protein